MRRGYRMGVLVFVLYACGGIVESSPERCPIHDPADMEGPLSCQTEGLLCTYGDSPMSCGRTFAECRQGSYKLHISPCRIPVDPCPAEVPAQGSNCSMPCGTPEQGCMSAACVYRRGIFCTCQTSPPGWTCTPPITDPRCPDFMPQFGGTCSVEGATCNYDRCRDGLGMSCTNGIWTHDNLPCEL